MERKQFDIPSVLRILQGIRDRFPDDIAKSQRAAQSQLRGMGITVDLEETQRQHEVRSFHPDADIIMISDDGMMFMQYRGKWIVGSEESQYLCFNVTPENILAIGPDGSVTVLNA